ncbi:MAG: FkbM family methyltransferase [Maricaulaceae bacterium]|jgi:FkbM family methyltransferase
MTANIDQPPASAAPSEEPEEKPLDEPWGAFAPNALERWVIAATRAAGPRGLKRNLASAMRAVITATHRGPFDDEIYGFKARLRPKQNLADKRALFYSRHWDAAERAFLESVVTPGFRFIDIGANTGLYSLFVAARAGDQALILAVEPQPEVRRWLAFNIAANGFSAVRVIDKAIAGGPGTARLGLPSGNKGTASIASEGEDFIEVETCSILDLMDAHGIDAADAMKIDIEGAEDQALPPFFETCPKERLPKHILMETLSPNWSVDCVDLARQAGYVETARSHMNVILSL